MKDYGDMSAQERHEDLWDQLTVARKAISTLQDAVMDLLGQRSELLDVLKKIDDLAGDIRLMDGSYLSNYTSAAIAKAEGES